MPVNHATKDIFKLLSGSLLAKIVGIAATMIFARILTKQQMAVFPIYLMLAGICNLILTFGIFSQFIRELPRLVREDNNTARSLVITAAFFISLATLVPAIVAQFFSGAIAEYTFRDRAQSYVIEIIGLACFAYAISKIVEYVMWGRAQYSATSIVQVFESVVRPLCTICLYLLLGYKGIVYGLALAQFLVAALGIYLIRDILIGPWPAMYPLGKLIKDSGPYYIGNYLAYFRTDGDQLLVNLILGPARLSEYFIAKTLYLNASLIYSAIDKVAVERLARSTLAKDFGEKAQQLGLQVARTAVPFTLLIIAVTPWAMAILAGPHYGGATWPAQILLAALLVRFVLIPIDRSVYLIVPGYIRVSYAVVETATVMISAVLLAPAMGITGAAVANLLGYCVTGAFGFVMLRRTSEIDYSLWPAGKMVLAALPGTIVAYFVPSSAESFGHAVLWSGIVASIWVVLFLASTFAIDRSEFAALWRLVRQGFDAAFSAVKWRSG